MDRPQLIRRLRIAASVLFTVVAVALCLLWMRSYWVADAVFKSVTRNSAVNVNSNCGIISIYVLREGFWGNYRGGQLTVSHGPPADSQDLLRELFQFGIQDNGPHHWLYFPHSALVLVFGTAAAISAWMPSSSRFSLRTLLVVTTLVAVVLGLGVWAVG